MPLPRSISTSTAILLLVIGLLIAAYGVLSSVLFGHHVHRVFARQPTGEDMALIVLGIAVGLAGLLTFMLRKEP